MFTNCFVLSNLKPETTECSQAYTGCGISIPRNATRPHKGMNYDNVQLDELLKPG